MRSDACSRFSDPISDSGVDSEFDDSSTLDEQIARLFDTSKNERRGGGSNSLTPDPSRMPLGYPTPLPFQDLAPMPKKEEIFGKSAPLSSH